MLEENSWVDFSRCKKFIHIWVNDTRLFQELVEKETLKSSEVVKAKLEELSEQLTKVEWDANSFCEFPSLYPFQMIKEVQKTEAGKKMTAAGAEALKQVCCFNILFLPWMKCNF